LSQILVSKDFKYFNTRKNIYIYQKTIEELSKYNAESLNKISVFWVLRSKKVPSLPYWRLLVTAKRNKGIILGRTKWLISDTIHGSKGIL